MRHYLFTLLILSGLALTSCRNDFSFEPSTGGLIFSKDTVYLDTVFSNIGSSTYTLKVYNTSNKDIVIPRVQLGKGLDSKYRITVDGMVGNNNRIFDNVELLAKDSMFIFIETTVNINEANPDDFLYTDQIEFHNIAAAPQTVELVTLIQDAVFLYPQRFDDGTTENLFIGLDGEGNEVRIHGFLLDENDPVNGNELLWTNEKPYVIYGFAGVPVNSTLHIQPGARVHFHANSGIYVLPNASIKALGLLSNESAPEANEIIFQGNRLEPMFSNVPGQWLTIWFANGSRENELRNVTIKNAVVGLLVSGNNNLNNPEADIQLENVKIYNSSNVGILARTGYISGNNVVINRAGQTALACSYGGKYNFNHSTFNNNWSSSRQLSVLIDNYIEGALPEIQPLEEATFTNCIIYGSNQVQFLINRRGNSTFNYFLDHCLIKFNNINNQFTDDSLYQFATDNTRYNNCLIATNNSQLNPNFFNVNQNNLKIDDTSGAKGVGNFDFSTGTFDILGFPRTSPSDLGAYNHSLLED